ncbi:hypothetical protein N752_05370 [Desulforamulus aquiferis]|nr:hypothetical protein N752_05370 [Desulforamulus aquiferis]
MPGLLAKYGDQFGDLTYDEGRSQVTHSIGCTDCHNPETMALRITRPALEDALTRRGQDWKLASRQEMRSLVCAQCHVEYYFTSDPRKVTFPWDKGFTAEQMEEYYGSYEQPVHVDWEHPQSGTKLLKAQHPEYEFSQGGTHNAAGVSCADCHMPYMREGNTKVTSHWWVSPTRTIQQSCTQCHRESEQWLLDRVHYIQDRQFEALRRAGNLNVQVIQEIEKSSQESTVDAALLEEARALHRSSQWRWDYMSAENSMGFHNSQEGLRTLNQAIDLAHRAIDTARRHGGFNNAKNKTKSFGTMEVANLHVPGYYTAAAGHCFCHCRHLQPTGICFTLVFVIKRVANPKYCLHYWCENPSINR